VDLKVIEARLKKLDGYYSSLLRFDGLSLADYLQSDDIQTIIERKLQLCIQTCIDIANYLISRKRLRIPDEEGNIFVVLSDEGIIGKELAERMKGMVNFRNILVHEYLEINNELVHRNLTQNLHDFNEFAQAIIQYLDL